MLWVALCSACGSDAEGSALDAGASAGGNAAAVSAGGGAVTRDASGAGTGGEVGNADAGTPGSDASAGVSDAGHPDAVPAGGTGGAAGGGGNMGAIPPPAGGSEPHLRILPWNGRQAALSFTFDDADPTHYDLAGPILAEHGLVATFYIVRDTVEGYGDVSRNGFADLAAAGHELGNHTTDHTSSSAGNAALVDDCHDYLQATFGAEVSSFAYPNGDRSATYEDAAAARYVASRNGGDVFIAVDDAIEWHNVPSIFVSDEPLGYTSTAPEVVAAIDETVTAGAWRVLTFHGIGPTGFFANVSEANLASIVERADDPALWVDTFARVAGYLRLQQLVEAAPENTTGQAIEWSWQPPQGVPSSLRLRAVVDGGTLLQSGTPIPWNDRDGYYPLDPHLGQLTWVPDD